MRGVRAFVVAGAVAVALGAAAGASPAAPAIHAHRGGSVLDGVPTFGENTLSAFRNASREGFVLEMDAKLTKDRVPVVFHDPELDRVTPCTGAVAERPLAKLAECPVDMLGSPEGGLGSKPAPRPEPIPTLADVLAFARNEGAFVNLEIKNQPGDADFEAGDAFAEDVMKVVLASGMPKDRLIVQSFYPNNLDVAKRRLPGVVTSLLTLSPLNSGAPTFAASNGYQWVSPQWPVSKDFVDQAHGLGRLVVPFTLNTAADITGAAEVGVDALITDDPALGRRALGLTRAQLAPDRLRPGASIFAPRYASDSARGPRFRLSAAGQDRGSGVARLTLETRRNSNASTRWRRLRGAVSKRSVVFRGRPGETHSFRARARDRFGNLSRYAYAATTVPFDDRSPRLRFLRGWSRVRSRRAYRRGLRRTTSVGARLALRFRGIRVGLVARRSRGAGRLLVEVGGRRRVVSLRGAPAPRQVVFRSRPLGPRIQRLRVTALGGGPVNVDAVAVERGPLPRP